MGNNWTTIKKPQTIADYKTTTTAPAEYKIGNYSSDYTDRLNTSLDTVTNWSYDPLKDASYQSLAKIYSSQGNIAAKNSMADAAALNGGYGTSYAVSAAQQARNQYNQQLAAMIPELENAAYNRASTALNALRDADNTAYSRFRDTESDRQWKYTQDYQKYRDLETDNQWKYTQQYNKYRDLMSDYQWHNTFNYQTARDKIEDRRWNLTYAMDRGRYNMEKEQFELSKKGSSSGGGRSGGGRRSGGYSGSGGGGYSGGSFGGNGGSRERTNYNIEAAQARGKAMTEHYKNQQKQQNSKKYKETKAKRSR